MSLRPPVTRVTLRGFGGPPWTCALSDGAAWASRLGRCGGSSAGSGGSPAHTMACGRGLKRSRAARRPGVGSPGRAEGTDPVPGPRRCVGYRLGIGPSRVSRQGSMSSWCGAVLPVVTRRRLVGAAYRERSSAVDRGSARLGASRGPRRNGGGRIGISACARALAPAASGRVRPDRSEVGSVGAWWRPSRSWRVNSVSQPAWTRSSTTDPDTGKHRVP